MRALIVTADDYGYRPAYDRGILAAASAGAVDAVSAMVGEGCDPEPLAASGVEVGLHLRALEGGREPRAALLEQWRRFERLFGRSPAYLDGHRHCHAYPPASAAVARFARERAVPVRSPDSRFRRTLRCLGVATPDLLVGRLREREPLLPAEVAALLAGEATVPGVVEWMVHPGHRDPAARSAYDAGREQDLALLLRLAGEERLRAVRSTHARALGS